MDYVRNIKSLIGYLYPHKCMMCHHVLSKLDDLFICRMCYDKIYAEMDYFSKIKANNNEELEAYVEIQEYNPRKIISLFPYETEYRKAILRWKYRGIRKYAKGFAKLLVDKGIFEEGYEEQTVLMPIPLAPSRMKKRGFNQAEDLAVEVSKQTGLPVLNCLKRMRNTKPQASCSKEERYLNAKESMCIAEKGDIKVKSIVLIDDIYTTGSTIKEAIRAIKGEYDFRNVSIDVIVVGKGES